MMEILLRYSAPTKLCLQEYGQIWKQMHDGECHTLYIQTSQNLEEAHWLKMGDFLEIIYHAKLTDDLFIKDCLDEFAAINKYEHE